MFAPRSHPSGAPPVEGAQAKGATYTPQLNTSSNPLEPGSAGSRKRGRDIHSLERFKQVVFGERGLPQLHAMVARNPILMYPPPDIEATPQCELEKKCVGEETEGNPTRDQDKTALGGPNGGHSEAKEALRNYHHKQLDTFLHLLYEFNHMTFVKLPMNDTLQLLSRCGREAVAHVTEYEMHQRIKRETRLRELRAAHDERQHLRSQRMALEEAQAQETLRRAEAAQCALEHMSFDQINLGDGMPWGAASCSINGLGEKESNLMNLSLPVDSLVDANQEVGTINAALPALEKDVDDKCTKHVGGDLIAEHELHSL